MALDKFYTNRDVALACKREVFALLGDTRPQHILEPSAGSGAFIEPEDGIVPFDLKPDIPWAQQMDSVHDAVPSIMADVMEDWPVKELLAIGNPPFGVEGRLALDFINLYLAVGGLVAFVLPISFRRWRVQKKVGRPLPRPSRLKPLGSPVGPSQPVLDGYEASDRLGG
jgi:hypothetical protein